MARKSENAEIAVLQDQMETVKEDTREIRADVKTILNSLASIPVTYVSKPELELIIMNVNKDIRNARSFNWLTHTLTAILTIILTVLIYYFFSHGSLTR